MKNFNQRDEIIIGERVNLGKEEKAKLLQEAKEADKRIQAMMSDNKLAPISEVKKSIKKGNKFTRLY